MVGQDCEAGVEVETGRLFIVDDVLHLEVRLECEDVMVLLLSD